MQRERRAKNQHRLYRMVLLALAVTTIYALRHWSKLHRIFAVRKPMLSAVYDSVKKSGISASLYMGVLSFGCARRNTDSHLCLDIRPMSLARILNYNARPYYQAGAFLFTRVSASRHCCALFSRYGNFSYKDNASSRYCFAASELPLSCSSIPKL